MDIPMQAPDQGAEGNNNAGQASAAGQMFEERPKLAAQRFKPLQQRLTDYFKLWRRGSSKEFEKGGRSRIQRQIRIPKRSEPWSGHKERKRNPLGRIEKGVEMAGDGDSQKRQAARAAARKKIGDLSGSRLGLRLGRPLGVGGQGVAYEVNGTWDDFDGEPLQAVCKTCLKEGDDLLPEKWQHTYTAGARHIVQRIVLEEPKEDADGSEGGTLEQTLDKRDDLLFIEFMRHGDLFNLLQKASTENIYVPNRVLWQIFDCLVKGVVALAYPDKWHKQGREMQRRTVAQETEDFERLQRAFGPPTEQARTLVHFDLDPQNILIGDFSDEGQHSITPVMKIADLGLCQVIDANFRRDPVDMWVTRMRGKYDIFTPEQFTEEWDWIGLAEVPDEDEATAGNYRAWTNLYQVGQLMWQLITHCDLEWPPVAAEVGRHWTYGSALLDENTNLQDIDLDLLMLVSDCMNHTPNKRPSLKYLCNLLKTKVNASPREKEQAEEFWNRIFAVPPTPETEPVNLSSMKGKDVEEADRPKFSFEKGDDVGLA